MRRDAIVLVPVVEELERELRTRGALPADYVPTTQRIPGYVLRMLALFTVAALAANYLRGAR